MNRASRSPSAGYASGRNITRLLGIHSITPREVLRGEVGVGHIEQAAAVEDRETSAHRLEHPLESALPVERAEECAEVGEARRRPTTLWAAVTGWRWCV